MYLNPKLPDAWAAANDPNNNSQIWLNVVSGKSGKLTWKAPFALGVFGEPGHVFRDEFADLNGDGVADVVGWGLPANGRSGPLVLKAYSGADGARCGPTLHKCTVPTFKAARTTCRWSAIWKAKASPKSYSSGNALGARTIMERRVNWWRFPAAPGAKKWTWQWTNVGNPLVPPLAVAFDGSGRRCVCLSITEVIAKNGGTLFQPMLVVLDATGKVRRRIEFNGNAVDPISFWRKADLLGDGREELLVHFESALQTLGGHRIEPLWKWPLPDAAKLLEIVPGANKAPATIAVWAGKSVYGISGATGRPRWRGEMPNSVSPVTYGPPVRVLLPDEDGLGLPRLLAANGCRLTWPTEESGRYAPPTPAPGGLTRRWATQFTARRLPWVPPSDRDVWTLVSIAFWAVLWLVVPWLLLRASIRHNSRWLAFIPALYQLATVLTLNQIPAEWLPWIPPTGKLNPHFTIGCVSLFLLVVNAVYTRRRLWLTVDASVIYAVAVALAWSHLTWNSAGFGEMSSGQPIGEGLSNLVGVFTFAIPTIAVFWLPAVWVSRGQWRRLGLFLLASLVLAAAAAALMLIKERDWIQPGEQYSFDGWWWIFGWGLYFASLLTLLALLAKTAFRGLRFAGLAAIRFFRRRSG